MRAYLVPRFGAEIAEDIKPLDIQRCLKSLHGERLQGHRHHACANACDSEGPPLTSPPHTGADLCRYGAPCFGDSCVTLVGLVVG